MIDYFKRCWRGEQPFWHVFWVWVVLVNGVWSGILLVEFGGGKFSENLLQRLEDASPTLALGVFLFCFVLIAPATLTVLWKNCDAQIYQRVISVCLWITYLAMVLVVAIAVTVGCMLISAGGNDCF